MYLTWKGVLASTIVGAGIGAGVGAAMGNTGKGAAIGAGAGLLAPVLAEGMEGMFDSARADATTALKDLRAAIKDGDAQAFAAAKTQFDTAMLEVQKAPEADK